MHKAAFEDSVESFKAVTGADLSHSIIVIVFVVIPCYNETSRKSFNMRETFPNIYSFHSPACTRWDRFRCCRPPRPEEPANPDGRILSEKWKIETSCGEPPAKLGTIFAVSRKNSGNYAVRFWFKFSFLVEAWGRTAKLRLGFYFNIFMNVDWVEICARLRWPYLLALCCQREVWLEIFTSHSQPNLNHLTVGPRLEWTMWH